MLGRRMRILILGRPTKETARCSSRVLLVEVLTGDCPASGISRIEQRACITQSARSGFPINGANGNPGFSTMSLRRRKPGPSWPSSDGPSNRQKRERGGPNGGPAQAGLLLDYKARYTRTAPASKTRIRGPVNSKPLHQYARLRRQGRY